MNAARVKQLAMIYGDMLALRHQTPQLADQEDIDRAWRALREAVDSLAARVADESKALAVLAHIRRSVRGGIVQIHEGSATMADIDAALAHLPDDQLRP